MVQDPKERGRGQEKLVTDVTHKKEAVVGDKGVVKDPVKAEVRV